MATGTILCRTKQKKSMQLIEELRLDEKREKNKKIVQKTDNARVTIIPKKVRWLTSARMCMRELTIGSVIH